jgi:predicted transcriptional regulator
MREGAFKVLDDKDIEFVDILRHLGMQRNVAKIITYLTVAGESNSREIERRTGMRQPEVSIAMRTLRRENWVREWEIKTEGKGRPSKVYALSTPVDEIIGSIEDQKQKESAEVMESIQKLKGLVSS